MDTTTDTIKYEILDEVSELNNSTSTIETKIKDLSIEDKIKDFIKEHNPKLFILTPCYGGQCYINYLTCLMNTVTLFRHLGFQIQVEFCKNDSLVPRARNNLVAKAMTDTDMTHIMFIDNDITWDPIDILKLILSEKEIIGGIYPLKNYDWSKLLTDPKNPYNSNIIQGWLTKKNQSQLKEVISDERMIQHNLLKYNVNYLDNVLEIKDNLAKVRHLATGFMMIRRPVIEQLIKSFPSTKYVDDVNFLKPEENEFAYALFDCGVEDGHYLSEDWLFCNRWTKLSKESDKKDIWMDVSIQLIHSGLEDFCGSYVSTIL